MIGLCNPNECHPDIFILYEKVSVNTFSRIFTMELKTRSTIEQQIEHAHPIYYYNTKNKNFCLLISRHKNKKRGTGRVPKELN